MTTIGQDFIADGEMDRYQSDCLRTWRRDDDCPFPPLMNAALGLGESGEVQDHIKKHYFMGHELNRDELVKEMGDVLYYLAVMAHELDVPLSLVARKNTAKLRERFPDGFSIEASVNRIE